jgi:hypothetical protein
MMNAEIKSLKITFKSACFEVLSIWNHNIKIEMQCQPYLDRDASDGLRGEGGRKKKERLSGDQVLAIVPDVQPAGEGGMPM